MQELRPMTVTAELRHGLVTIPLTCEPRPEVDAHEVTVPGLGCLLVGYKDQALRAVWATGVGRSQDLPCELVPDDDAVMVRLPTGVRRLTVRLKGLL